MRNTTIDPGKFKRSYKEFADEMRGVIEGENLKIQKNLERTPFDLGQVVERLIRKCILNQKSAEVQITNEELGVSEDPSDIQDLKKLMANMRDYGCFNLKTSTRNFLVSRLLFIIDNFSVDKMRLFINEQLKPDLSPYNNTKIEWSYNSAKNKSQLNINDFMLHFRGKRRLIIDFFYKNRGGSKQWYQTADLKDPDLTSAALGKAVQFINKRVNRVANHTIKELIQIKEKDEKNPTEQNFYRWAL